MRPNPPDFAFIVCELSMRQPVGGRGVMAPQLRHMVEQFDLRNISVRVIPTSVATHPGLQGSFVMFEFSDEPTIVCVESRLTAMYPDDPKLIEVYRSTADRLMDLALAEKESQDLLHAIAEDMESGRSDTHPEAQHHRLTHLR